MQAIFGEVAPGALAHLRRHLRWVEIAGGDTLMHQGEEGDSMYLIVSGRLRAYVRAADGSERMVGEMARGQTVGEMSLYTGEPRAATVVAVRDSVLVRLAKSEFVQLLESSAQVSIALTRQIVRRLQGEQQQTHERPVAIGLVPITCGVDMAAFAAELARQVGERLAQTQGRGRVRVVDAAQIGQALAEAGVALDDADPEIRAEASRRVALLLDEIEATHDAVLLLADEGPSPWTQRCCRHCDELLLLADATQPAALHAVERQFLLHRPPRTEVAELLVLLHPAERRSPRGTATWLQRRPLAGHVHLRPVLARDMARMARLLTRTAVGLVLAGGGARGFAHLGVYRVLREQGVEIDWVGGTSIGAVMAAYVASDQPLDRVMDNARSAFARNPTGDMNLFPLLSLFKGVRLHGVLRRAVQELVDFDADIEDLWKNYHCVATNYSRACEQRIAQGNLVQALLASIAIPGALPPVVRDGELLCDGGTFNNFPVDQMRRMRGVGYVIGVDLSLGGATQVPPDGLPGNISLWRDRLRPAAQRRYRLPSLPAYLMTVTGLYSLSRRTQAQQGCDLYFHPALERVGMLQWKSIDPIIARGYAHGRTILAALDGTQRRQLGLYDGPDGRDGRAAPAPAR
ncbi:MAG TPA: patatin-like phospholipase family protein [Pseudorhodoferax sp.]|nr:patatin-like phospholipase family protein [Pseudorhodoferax sp.]